MDKKQQVCTKKYTVILITDNGGSKTDQALISLPTDTSKYVLRVRTRGVNPSHRSKEVILKALEQELKPVLHKATERNDSFLPRKDIAERVSQIAFCGTGYTKNFSSVVSEALTVSFPSALIKMESDLLGTAHTACRYDAGIACILGTDANSYQCDGENVVANVPPLGYILGDEGSGAVLSKLLLNDIFRGGSPTEIRGLYLEWGDLTYPEITNRVYRQPLANRYLEGISKFIKEDSQYAKLESLVRFNFDNFFKKNILKYTTASARKISAVGGTVATFEERLRTSASTFSFKVGKVIASPIDRLIEYYS